MKVWNFIFLFFKIFQFRGKGGRRMRRSSPAPRSGHSGKRKLIAGSTGWYQVTVSSIILCRSYEMQATFHIRSFIF